MRTRRGDGARSFRFPSIALGGLLGIAVSIVVLPPWCVHRAAAGTNVEGMVRVPAGDWLPLFAKSEETQRVEEFLLDELPVTNAEFLEFVRANPRWMRSRAPKIFADAHYLGHWAGDLELGDPSRVLPDGPVTYVSWFAARAYAEWRGKRLPTLGEWELAAAASETMAQGKDDPEHYRRILEWYGRPTHFPLPAVTTGPRNFFGVRGLHALVWEWVEDFNTALVTGESRADAGLERDLFCGAGAAGASDFRDYAAFMRYAFRSSLSATYAVPNLGFRCARDVPAASASHEASPGGSPGARSGATESSRATLPQQSPVSPGMKAPRDPRVGAEEQP